MAGAPVSEVAGPALSAIAAKPTPDVKSQRLGRGMFTGRALTLLVLSMFGTAIGLALVFAIGIALAFAVG